MNAVALAATIGGTFVALAGVAATVWAGSQQRKSAKELADGEHAHERELARRARLFERRSLPYEVLLGGLIVFSDLDRVEPPSDEQWSKLETPVRVLWSRPVADNYNAFKQAVGAFYGQAGQTQAAREQVRDALAVIERTMSDELASL